MIAWNRLKEYLRREGWMLVAIIAAAGACLLLGAAEHVSPAGTQEELRLSQVLSAMDGAGAVEVAVFYGSQDDALPCGAVVVAQGADDVAVRLRLSRAVSTLLGLDESKVEVFKRKEGS